MIFYEKRKGNFACVWLLKATSPDYTCFKPKKLKKTGNLPKNLKKLAIYQKIKKTGNFFQYRVLRHTMTKGCIGYPAFFAIRYSAGYPVAETGYPVSGWPFTGYPAKYQEKGFGGKKHNFFQIKFITSNGPNAIKYNMPPNTTVNWI